MKRTDALPWSTAALPKIVSVGRYQLDDREFEVCYRGPTHALHLYDYDAEMIHSGNRIRLRPGDLTLSPAGGETRYHLSRAGQHWCIHFEPATQKGTPCALPLHLSLGGGKARAVDAIQRISGLCAVPSAEAALCRCAASAALQELLLTLAARAAHVPTRERVPKSREAVMHAASLIDEHFVNPLSATALARRVGLSPNWLARAFREHFGSTMPRYLLARRIAHAQELLRTTNLPVGRMAERLGFLDAQHFNKQFRRVLGCSPTAYRLRGDG